LPYFSCFRLYGKDFFPGDENTKNKAKKTFNIEKKGGEEKGRVWNFNW
jgi:hypothetical protein